MEDLGRRKQNLKKKKDDLETNLNYQEKDVREQFFVHYHYKKKGNKSEERL